MGALKNLSTRRLLRLAPPNSDIAALALALDELENAVESANDSHAWEALDTVLSLLDEALGSGEDQ